VSKLFNNSIIIIVYDIVFYCICNRTLIPTDVKFNMVHNIVFKGVPGIFQRRGQICVNMLKVWVYMRSGQTDKEAYCM